MVWLVGIRERRGAGLAAALDRAENDGLVVAPMLRRFRFGHASCELAADVGLVGFHDAAQHLAGLVVHRGADAVAEIPGGLVGHTEHPLQLVRADALLRLAHHVDGEEPLPQREFGVVEERADPDARTGSGRRRSRTADAP